MDGAENNAPELHAQSTLDAPSCDAPAASIAAGNALDAADVKLATDVRMDVMTNSPRLAEAAAEAELYRIGWQALCSLPAITALPALPSVLASLPARLRHESRLLVPQDGGAKSLNPKDAKRVADAVVAASVPPTRTPSRSPSPPKAPAGRKGDAGKGAVAAKTAAPGKGAAATKSAPAAKAGGSRPPSAAKDPAGQQQQQQGGKAKAGAGAAAGAKVGKEGGAAKGTAKTAPAAPTDPKGGKAKPAAGKADPKGGKAGKPAAGKTGKPAPATKATASSKTPPADDAPPPVDTPAEEPPADPPGEEGAVQLQVLRGVVAECEVTEAELRQQLVSVNSTLGAMYDMLGKRLSL